MPVAVASLKKEKVASSSKVTLATLAAFGVLVKLNLKTLLNSLVLVEYSPTDFFPIFKSNKLLVPVPSLKLIISLVPASDKNPIVVPVVELLSPISTGAFIVILESVADDKPFTYTPVDPFSTFNLLEAVSPGLLYLSWRNLDFPVAYTPILLFPDTEILPVFLKSIGFVFPFNNTAIFSPAFEELPGVFTVMSPSLVKLSCSP